MEETKKEINIPELRGIKFSFAKVDELLEQFQALSKLVEAMFLMLSEIHKIISDKTVEKEE
jgi:hypothetical protein